MTLAIDETPARLGLIAQARAAWANFTMRERQLLAGLLAGLLAAGAFLVTERRLLAEAELAEVRATREAQDAAARARVADRTALAARDVEAAIAERSVSAPSVFLARETLRDAAEQAALKARVPNPRVRVTEYQGDTGRALSALQVEITGGFTWRSFLELQDLLAQDAGVIGWRSLSMDAIPNGTFRMVYVTPYRIEGGTP